VTIAVNALMIEHVPGKNLRDHSDIAGTSQERVDGKAGKSRG
jgi:hypothetical protein